MKEKVIELWKKGLTDKEIAVNLKLLRRRVSKIRFEAGLISNNPKRLSFNLEEIKELLKNNSITKIAKLKNCSVESIRSFMKKHELNYLFNSGKNPTIPSTISLSKRQEEILIGMMFGDGYFQKRKNTPMVFCKHSIKQKEYCYWKFLEFKSLNSIYSEDTRKSPDLRNGKYYLSALVRVNCNVNFNKYYDLFYKNNVKYINPKILDYYTALSLAVHFMDDGTKLEGSYVLCTNCFTKEELKIFQNFLLKKWNIETTLHKTNTIYIKRKSKNKFESLIIPYIHNSMKYKIYCSL